MSGGSRDMSDSVAVEMQPVVEQMAPKAVSLADSVASLSLSSSFTKIDAPLESSVGNLGESRDPNAPLYRNLKRIEAVLPAKSELGSERDILLDHMYNKRLGHGQAYENVTELDYLLSEDSIAIDNADGTAVEFERVTLDKTVKVLDKDSGQYQDYIPVKLQTSNPGIIAQALISPATGDMKVLFRGTSDLETAKADLEIGGPGAESYAADMNSLMAQTNALVAQYGIRKITSTGHSLGGALAQQYEQSLIDALAQNLGFAAEGRFHIPSENRNHLSQLNEVTGNFYNSAGAPQNVVERNPIALKYLTAQKASTKIRGHHFHVGGDLVQLLGHGSIFAGVPPEDALVTMLKVQNGNEGRGLRMAAAAGTVATIAGATVGSMVGPVGTALGGAVAGSLVGGATGAIVGMVPAAIATHCNDHFNEQDTSKEIGYILATNETPAGLEMIRQKISHKSQIVNHPITQAVQQELVLAARHGGVASAVGGLAVGVKAGIAAGAVAGPVGALVGGTAGAVVGAVGSHRIKNMVLGAADAVANAFSTAGAAIKQDIRKAGNYVAEKARSTVRAVKNFFWGPAKTVEAPASAQELQTLPKAANNSQINNPVPGRTSEVAVSAVQNTAVRPEPVIFAGPKVAVAASAPAPVVAPAVATKRRYWPF
jgi:hypothetical protein